MRRPITRRLAVKAIPGISIASDWLAWTQVPNPSIFQVRATPLFVRQDGKLKRILSAAVREPDRQSGTIELSSGGRTTRIELGNSLRSGNRVLLPVDPPEQDTIYDCVYRDPARTLETRVRVLPERQWKIYVVHHSHHDPGYEGLPSHMRGEFIKVLDEAVRYCDQTRSQPEETRFKWNIEVSYLLEDYRKARGEEALRKIIELVKSGSMEIGALYCSLQTDLMTVEPLHRVAHYATSTLAKEFGINIQAAVLDDVPGFTWGLPEVLARSGVRYFLFSGNSIRSNLSLEALPILFYWEGPAGGKVLTWRPVRYDEGMHLTSRRGNKVSLSEPDALTASILDRYSRGDYPYDAILLHAAADFIDPYPELSDHVARWNSHWEFPKLRLATISEFFRYVEGRYASQIPSLRGGYPDAWNDLRGSMAREAALARRTENELPDAEKWATLASLAGGPVLSTELNAAYDNLLMFEEHTIGWEAGKHDIYVDESEGGGKRHYQEKVAPLNEAAATAERVRAASLSFLGRKVRHGRSPRVVVWNPLSWSRTGLVRMPAPEMSTLVLREVAGGAVVPHQVVKTSGTPDLVFVAQDVPACGYRAFELDNTEGPTHPSEFQCEALSLENRYYRVRLNPVSGGLASVIDKETGKELVDARAPYALNQLVYVLSEQVTYRDFRDLAEMRPGPVQVTRGSAGPVAASLKISGAIERILGFEQEVILYSGLKRVDLVTHLHKKPIYAREGLYVAFPFRIASSQRYGKFEIPVKIDIPGGYMRPDADQLRGSSHDYYVAQHGVLLEDREKAVFWTSVDAPVVEFGRIQSNRWNTKLAGDYNWLERPWVYSFVMNNHWYTNAPIAQGGPFTFRYSFTSRASGGELTRDKQFGWETLSPMSATQLEPGAGGDWAEFGSLAAVEPANVALAGIKTADDGSGIILRLAEVAGLACTPSVQISVPGREVRQAMVCSTNEDTLRPARIKNGRIVLELAPFEMTTVRVVLAKH